MEVYDASGDPRFANNPLVTGSPEIRFYCGVPLRTPEGHGLGTLCLIDRVPRTLSPTELGVLQALARQVESELEIRRRVLLLEQGLEAQQRNQQGKEMLASMMVHDLRAPLTSISLLHQLISDERPDATDLLDEMLGEVERMKSMLSDVLDICLAETGALRLRRCSFGIQNLIRKIEPGLTRTASQRGQRIFLDLPADPVLIDGDPELIERVVANVAGNAVKHGPAGKAITIRARTKEMICVLEICDEGNAIPSEARRAIFDPLVQLSTLHSSHTRGYGLGLAFSKLAVDAHGGAIVVEPGEHRGNVFRIELPLAPPFAHSAPDLRSAH